ncbi:MULTISPECIES: YjzD family protein [Solibacillus]|uniref:YjzD family protein n=1 Tax=Solibacillus merdavium TaxID=2762218 RepID=A0ABR8XHU7_9BACL|nr:YjzD family protein [Solibacillus merdavium]MBD8031510.1 YjzD family protein [Solibacillus merdavium]
MQYIITFFWSFLLVTMTNYVVSSVLGVNFNFMNGVIVSLVFSVLVIIIAAIIPNESTPEIEAEQH